MSHDDFAIEPVPGLPERPPEGEVILWQGRPNWWALCVDAYNVYWVVGYFTLLASWRFITLVDLRPMSEAFMLSTPFLVLGGIVAALLALIAFVQARSTLYTITTARVAMRIGAALTVTLNLPFRQIARADLAKGRHGTGTIVLGLAARPKLSFLVMWPHTRPWRFARPEPALRAIPNAAEVAAILAENADAHLAKPIIETRTLTGGVVAAE